jgi:hypothetical protein
MGDFQIHVRDISAIGDIFDSIIKRDKKRNREREKEGKGKASKTFRNYFGILMLLILGGWLPCGVSISLSVLGGRDTRVLTRKAAFNI